MGHASVIIQDDAHDIRTLSEINHRRTVLKFLLILAGMSLSFLLAKLGTDNQLFLLFVPAFLVTSWTQHAITEELHDGSHYRLVSKRRLNEQLSGLYGSLIGISLINFRVRHKMHHRYFGTHLDPDLSQYKSCPVGLKAWISYLFVNFSGYGAVKSLITRQGVSTGKPSLQHPGFTVVMQLVLLLFGVLFKLPLFYFFFWLLPLITLTYGVSHFRTMLEHWNAETWQDPITGETCYGAFYDFNSGIQRHLLGAQFGYNKHGTHHSLPSVPNYNLDKAAHEDYREVPATLIRTTTFLTRFNEMRALSLRLKAAPITN